jgi:hypothetical protein
VNVSSPWRDRASAALPYLVFGTLYVLTWKRWIFPFQDHGREMNVAARLADGETLYRDVAIAFGPLPAYVDALALRLFGRSLDVLIALRTLVAIAGIEALRRLLARITPGPLAASSITAFVVASCFFGYGSAWPFPYSVAALEGTVATWWAVELALAARSFRGALGAAVIAGLAAGTKLEIGPAALVGLVLALWGRLPRREMAVAAGLAAALAFAAWGGPLLLLGPEVLAKRGFLVALHNPEPWRRMQLAIAFGDMSPRAFLHGGYALAVLPSLFYLGGAFILVRALHGRSGLALAAFATGLASAAIPRNEELHLLLPLAAAFLAFEAWRALRCQTFERPYLAAGAAMLFALWRQPFLIRIAVYSAFAAPLALALALAYLTRRPHFRAVAFLTLGLCVAQLADRVSERNAIPMTWVSLPRAAHYLPSETAGMVAGLAGTIERSTPPGAWVAGFPEPGLLLFATGRRSPFSDEQFFPGNQNERAQDEMIRRLDERPPALAFQTNQTLHAFGAGEYRHGVLDRFFRAFDARMRPAFLIGDPRDRIRHLGTATSVIVYVPRDGIAR